ncbi:MAG: hypothetical protein J0M02_08015, partial [Planctomycetes bacterium]|nr:hypothetical protein [Planctomycetota bacterium]
MRHLLLLLAAVLCWAGESAPAAAPAYQDVMIENAHARAVLSTFRGNLVRFELATSSRIALPAHLQALVQPVPEGWLPVLRSFQRYGAHNWLADHDAAAGGLETADTAPWQVTKPSPDKAVFTYEKAGRLRWTLTYQLDPQRPALGVDLSITNLSGSPVTLAPSVVPINGVHQDYGPGEAYYGCVFDHVGGAAGAITNHGMPGIGATAVDLPGSQANVDYLGVKSRFFAAWWSPRGIAPAPAAVETA